MVTALYLANIAIAFGCFALSAMSAPWLPCPVWKKLKLKLWMTRWSGFCFFLCCGTLRVDMAVHALSGNGMPTSTFYNFPLFFLHVAQGLAVWGFVYGLYREALVKHRD